MESIISLASRAFLPGLVVAVGLGLSTSTTPANAGKPVDLGMIPVVLDGDVSGIPSTNPQESSGTLRTGKQVSVEVVVRNFNTEVSTALVENSEVCFGVTDEGAAGKFILLEDGTASFEVFPELWHRGGESQLYAIVLEGSHGLSADQLRNFLTNLPTDVTFDTGNIEAEGRGKRKLACTGDNIPIVATATFSVP